MPRLATLMALGAAVLGTSACVEELDGVDELSQPAKEYFNTNQVLGRMVDPILFVEEGAEAEKRYWDPRLKAWGGLVPVPRGRQDTDGVDSEADLKAGGVVGTAAKFDNNNTRGFDRDPSQGLPVASVRWASLDPTTRLVWGPVFVVDGHPVGVGDSVIVGIALTNGAWEALACEMELFGMYEVMYPPFRGLPPGNEIVTMYRIRLRRPGGRWSPAVHDVTPAKMLEVGPEGLRFNQDVIFADANPSPLYPRAGLAAKAKIFGQLPQSMEIPGPCSGTPGSEEPITISAKAPPSARDGEATDVAAVEPIGEPDCPVPTDEVLPVVMAAIGHQLHLIEGQYDGITRAGMSVMLEGTLDLGAPIRRPDGWIIEALVRSAGETDDNLESTFVGGGMTSGLAGLPMPGFVGWGPAHTREEAYREDNPGELETLAALDQQHAASPDQSREEHIAVAAAVEAAVRVSTTPREDDDAAADKFDCWDCDWPPLF